MAEQNFNQAIKIADRGYIIVHGEIEFTAENAEELANNEMIKQYYLGVWGADTTIQYSLNWQSIRTHLIFCVIGG